MAHIGIIGAGAWGTALSNLVCKAGNDVVLWARESEVCESINNEHFNHMFLPNISLDPQIRATRNFQEAVISDLVLIAVPSQKLRFICKDLARYWKEGTPAVICSKGIELGSNKLLIDVISEALPEALPLILSGPTFADEVALGLPTAVTIACENDEIGKFAAKVLATESFRPYLSSDVIGASIGGAVKNVMAIACGLIEGRSLGNNARASIITRGLVEIIRLAVVLGGQERTLSGLSGLGDLLLTSTSVKSRNFSLGVALGKGIKLDKVLAERSSVTEGVNTSAAVTSLASTVQVDMPICRAVDQILNHSASIDSEIINILKRPIRNES